MNNINEEEIAKTVELTLKKDGTFDKIRKMATDRLKNSESLKILENEVQGRVESILKASQPNIHKEELHRMVRTTVETDSRLKFKIKQEAKAELEQQYVNELLTEVINREVDKILETFTTNQS